MARFHELTVTDVRKTIRDAVVVTLKPVNGGDFDFVHCRAVLAHVAALPAAAAQLIAVLRQPAPEREPAHEDDLYYWSGSQDL